MGVKTEENPRAAQGGRVLINRLSRLMGERRLSIAEVARGSGVSYRALYDLYHDKTTRIEFETLDRLCFYFEVEPGVILEHRPLVSPSGAPVIDPRHVARPRHPRTGQGDTGQEGAER